MKSKFCTNIKDLEEYLCIFEEDMKKRKTIETPFGLQNVSSGYQIKSINLLEGFAKIEVYMKDRKIKEKDEYLRGGDEAYFTIKDGKVYSYQEWEDYVDMIEKQYEQLDNDSVKEEPIVENEKILEDDDEFLM